MSLESTTWAKRLLLLQLLTLVRDWLNFFESIFSLDGPSLTCRNRLAGHTNNCCKLSSPEQLLLNNPLGQRVKVYSTNIVLPEETTIGMNKQLCFERVLIVLNQASILVAFPSKPEELRFLRSSCAPAHQFSRQSGSLKVKNIFWIQINQNAKFIYFQNIKNFNYLQTNCTVLIF